MPDNPPSPQTPQGSKGKPINQTSSLPRPKSPTTQLPLPRSATATGKIVVMLSSVAKQPGASQSLHSPEPPAPALTAPTAPLPGVSIAAKPSSPVVTPTVAPALRPPSSATSSLVPPAAAPSALKQTASLPSAAPAAVAPSLIPPNPASSAPPKVTGEVSQIVKQGAPPLAPTQVIPAATTPPAQAKLSTTTYVQLPPKTAAPALVSLAGQPLVPADKKPAAKVFVEPLLPAKLYVAPPVQPRRPETGRLENKKTSLIKLNTTPAPVDEDASPDDSLLVQPGQTPAPVKAPPPKVAAPTQSLLERPTPKAVLPTPVGAPVTAPKPAASIPSIAPAAAPPLAASARSDSTTAKAGPILNPAPVPLEAPKAPENAHPLHVAPRLIEKAAEPGAEKLPQPHHFIELKKDAPSEPMQKAPAMITPAPAAAAPPAATSAPATGTPAAKPKENLSKKSSPIMLTSTAKIMRPDVVEMKPALKPAVLPKRSIPLPNEPVAPAAEVKPAETKAPETKPPEAKSSVISTVGKAAGPVSIALASMAAKVEDKKAPAKAEVQPAAKVESKPQAKSQQIPDATAKKIRESKPATPLTRVERARNRRFRETLIYWLVLVPLTLALLIFGILRFGRDTRVEGQVIPPEGMTLAPEMWIVSDFRELASGISEDLAQERAPLMQEVQERRDHVQRAQADVASREERIRLLQEQINASKDEIAGVVKKARDATQKIWDDEGAEIDNEYQAHLEAIRHAIADRAASLKLNYNPDPTYPSPEVWANAFRLALYDVPAGVDSVKEHQWLGDQMKQWRDFQKTLDDRKEALREKAAQVKLEPAPKIADLNAKIADLSQRIDATQTEEVPLKAELEQAQVDLTQAEAADTNLDDKYYKQLDGLPAESVTKHIAIRPNGRFTWIEDDAFAEGEKEHKYWIFTRATRADGREYWALHHFSISQNQTVEMVVEPPGFQSTKAILRPNLSPEEQEQ